jgi:ATP-dependent Clp protease ATP-binding subunit ClpA
LVKDQELSIEAEPAVLEKLVELGYDPALGARPLKRVIARLIQDPLAEALLSGRYNAGQTIRIGLDTSGELSFGV